MIVYNNFQEAVIRDIAVWIDAHINDRITIDRLSDHSGYSKWYLQRLFKKHSGISLGEYVRFRKLNKAAALLHLTSMRIYQIADMLGFDSHQTFHRNFFRFFGITPAEYRRCGEWPASIPVPDLQKVFSPSCRPDIKMLEEFVVSGRARLVRSDLEIQAPDDDFERTNIYETFGVHVTENESLMLISRPEHAASVEVLTIEMFAVHDISTGNAAGESEERLIKSGLYLEVQATIYLSQIHEWVIFNYDYTLPANGLTRREGFDLEYIRIDDKNTTDNPVVSVRYLIPVKN